jgi:Family of unknown function (DUF6504)
MRRYRDPVDVTLAADGLPAAFRWRGTWYRVAVIGSWRLEARWWEPERAAARVYYRVQTRDHQVFELYHDRGPHQLAVAADTASAEDTRGQGAWVLDVVHD